MIRNPGIAELLLHPQDDPGPIWRLLPAILAVAFAVRAAVALSGDLTLHPDEIFQYLEPAHRLAFGNGVVYWEFFYGARSWLIPAFVATILKAFDAVGLGHPQWYVDGVKLAFCAASLSVPACMYLFARRHFNETAGRAALLMGALWWELAVLAHKPLAELASTAMIAGLLALCVRPSPQRARVVWATALLAVLAAYVRYQYAPVAAALLGLAMLRLDRRGKAHLALASACLLALVGALDGLSWGGGWMESVRNNIRLNLHIGLDMAGTVGAAEQLSLGATLLLALPVASGGLALCVIPASAKPRRYGLLLALIVLALAPHLLSPHKELRFIFVVVPLWLLVCADWAAAHRLRLTLVGTVAAAFSLLGVLVVALGREGGWAWVPERNPAFIAYRHLASAPGVKGVWHVGRQYGYTPGYYHLHRKVPFYAGEATPAGSAPTHVSHLVVEDPQAEFPGYVTDWVYGEGKGIRVLRRADNAPPVRQWLDYAPIVRGFNPSDDRPSKVFARAPPANFGIRYSDPEAASG